jgi:hypothetical protein
MTDTDQITQLQTQQGLQTQAFINALEGRWVGANSVEAIVYALNPGIQGTLILDSPITQSEAGTAPPK